MAAIAFVNLFIFLLVLDFAKKQKIIRTSLILKENSIFAGAKQTNMEYTILIHKDVEGGWYCGQCQQLPGAISEGKTLDELMENMKDAIQLVLEYNAVPRHPDVSDYTAKTICKQLGIPIINYN